MHLEQFEGCCGARIIHGFGEDPELEAVDTAAQERDLVGLIDEAKNDPHTDSHAGVVFAILVDKYQKKAKALIVKHGFKEVLKFKNPNSGNRLTTYVLDLTKKPVRKRKAATLVAA